MIVWSPTLKLDVLNEAVPLPFSGTWARTLEPSWKVTMPDGTVDAGGVGATVAVNVTVCPGFEGFGDELRVVVVALAWTFCTRVALPPLKLVSPL